MRSPGINIFVAITITAVIQMISCAPESCLEETVANVKVPLYLNSTQKIKAPDSLIIYGLSRASDKLYNSAKRTTQADLPLNPSTESCGFVIRINRVPDTIMIKYESYPHLISKECGYTYFHTIDSISYTKHIIDTIIIMNRLVTTVDEENFRILY